MTAVEVFIDAAGAPRLVGQAPANIDTETEKIINYGIEVLKQGISRAWSSG